MNRSPVGRAPCAWAGAGHITSHSRRAMAIGRMRAGPMGTGEYIHWGTIGGTIGGPMTPSIDVHTHIFASGWPDFAARYGGDRWPRLEGDPATGCRLYLGGTLNRSLTPHAFDPARRIEDMDRTGVGRQLLSPAPPTFCYWAPGPAAAEWCRMQNDAIAELVGRHPARLLGAGGLPLQATDLAVKELERVVSVLRFPAVEIGANVAGLDLDDAALAPVWDAAAALGVAIFVHPQAPILGDPRFRKDNLT